MAATDDAGRCKTLIEELDKFLQRAKLMPGVAKQVFQARDQAIAHQSAGKHSECIASITVAYRLLGRSVDQPSGRRG